MPGEETKHEPVGQWGTGYSPQQTQLHFTPVQYANYAPMLQAIEAAGSNILHYLNPATIQQMKLDVASSKAGQSFLDWAQRPENKDAYFRSQAGVANGRFEMTPGYVNPILRVGEPKPPAGNTGDVNRVNPTTVSPAPAGQTNTNGQTNTGDSNSVPQQNGFQYFTDPNSGVTLNFPRTMSQGGPVHMQQGGAVPWQEETYFGGQGVPPAPAPQPTPTPQPTPIMPARTPTYFAGQPAENRPVMFSPSPNQVPPPPMPAQVQTPGALPGHIPYSPESQAQAYQQGTPLAPEEMARRQQEQQNLTAWQNQTQGGILSAVEARDWAKNAIDTDITRAVYLPQGGPPGPGGQREPAYAFYGKKNGAANVVPISQMVKAGAGPLVAAGNITQMLSSGGQQGQQPQGQPQGQPQQPPQLAGAAPPALGGGPPPAPGPNVAGQLPPDEFARRVAAATNVPNAGGPPPSQLITGINQAGTVDKGGVEVQSQGPAVTNAPDASEIKNLEDNYANKGSTRFNDRGDPYIGDSFNGWGWYKSDKGKGISYVERPGQGGFWRQRYYLGDDHWENVLPPEQAMRQTLLEEMPQLGFDQIQRMDAKTLQNNLATYWNMHNLTPMSDQANQQLNDERQHILSATRVLDAIGDRDPAEFNSTAQWENNQIRNLSGEYTKNPSTPAEYANNLKALVLGGVTTGGRRADPAITFVGNEYDKLLHHQLGLNEGAPMTLDQRNSADKDLGGVLSGQPDALEGLKRHLDDVKASFRQHVLAAIANNQKISGIYTDMNNDIGAGKPIWDDHGWQGVKGKPGPGVEQDSIQTAKGNKVAPSVSPTPAPAAPGASPTPVLNGPGSSQSNPLHIRSDQEYYNAHGVWVADDHGRVKFKP